MVQGFFTNRVSLTLFLFFSSGLSPKALCVWNEIKDDSTSSINAEWRDGFTGGMLDI